MKQTTILFSLICIFAFSCKKDNSDDIIPYVPVNTTIYLSLPEYAPLNSIGNSVFIDGGYRGLVVYRRALTEFVAYDRACPYDPTATGAKLVLDSSKLTDPAHFVFEPLHHTKPAGLLSAAAASDARAALGAMVVVYHQGC